jgi:hypothetical protein
MLADLLVMKEIPKTNIDALKSFSFIPSHVQPNFPPALAGIFSVFSMRFYFLRTASYNVTSAPIPVPTRTP